MLYAVIMAIVFLAALEQTISGFGFSLLVMPIFTLMLGLPIGAPLVALQGVTLYIVNLIRYYRRVRLGEALRLAAAATLGVPIGVWALINVSADIIKFGLGVLLIGYAVYSLWGPVTPYLKSQRWVYLAGFVSGCLGGAYNTSGPPVVIYGSLRQWPKEEFRAILQVNFLLTGTLTVMSHYFSNRLTPSVLTFFALAVPAQLLGVLVGSRLDPKVDKQRFRVLITAMILLLGISTLADALR